MTPATRKHVLFSAGFGLFLIAFVVLLARGLQLNPAKVPSALLGKPAAALQVKWFQGQDFLPAGARSGEMKWEDMKGHPVVLNFWASWCVSCREEASFFEKFWQRYKEQGLLVVGVAIQDEESAAQEFARFFGKSYILGLDQTGKASIDYGVYGVPETFLIDAAGIIQHKEAGPMNLTMLEQYLPKIMPGSQ